MELPNKKFFRPVEVARHFNVSRSSIYGWIEQGKLPAVKIVGSLRIRREDIISLEKQGEMEVY